MVSMDMVSLMQENHLLRKINRVISFGFIYGLQPVSFKYLALATMGLLVVLRGAGLLKKINKIDISS